MASAGASARPADAVVVLSMCCRAGRMHPTRHHRLFPPLIPGAALDCSHLPCSTVSSPPSRRAVPGTLGSPAFFVAIASPCRAVSAEGAHYESFILTAIQPGCSLQATSELVHESCCNTPSNTRTQAAGRPQLHALDYRQSPVWTIAQARCNFVVVLKSNPPGFCLVSLT